MVLYDGHVESTIPRFGQVADRAHQESCGQVYWNHARFQVDRIRTGIYLVPGWNDSTFVISRARKTIHTMSKMHFNATEWRSASEHPIKNQTRCAVQFEMVVRAAIINSLLPITFL